MKGFKFVAMLIGVVTVIMVVGTALSRAYIIVA